MKKVLIVAPILSGRGGTETVIQKVMLHYNKSDSLNINLLLLGEPDDLTWLNDIDADKITICKEKNKLVRVIWYFFFWLRSSYDQFIIINTQLIHVTNIFRKLTRKRTVITSWIHFSLLDSETVNMNFLKEADNHLAISSGIEEQLVMNGVDSTNINVIYNPIERHELMKRDSSKPIHFIYVGRIQFNHQKNLETLLDACYLLNKDNNDWVLDVYGDGDDLEKCKAYAQKLGLNEKIVWFGWLDKPWQKINKADCLILSSNMEGLSMTLLEALSRGIPCISSDCPVGSSDIIQVNKNGFLTKMNDANDMYDKMNYFIIHRSEFLGDLRETIKEFYVESYFERLDSSLI